MELIGLPPHSREQVVLAVRPLASLREDCDVRLYRDGQQLTQGGRVLRSEHELWVTLPVAELGRSWQFTGEVCGAQFELDAVGREAIADFVARFHERVDELSDPAPAPVANAGGT